MRTLCTMMLLSLTACGSDAKGDGDTGLSAGSAKAEELRGLIDGHESWPQRVDGITPSGNGHGAFVQNWLNTTADAHVAMGDGSAMPDDAILVKQGYSDEAGAELGNLTVMWKTEGDWFWVAFNPAGDVIQEGFTADVEGPCSGCHTSDPGQQDLVISYDW